DMTPDELKRCKDAFRKYEMNAQHLQALEKCIVTIRDDSVTEINKDYAQIFKGVTLPADYADYTIETTEISDADISKTIEDLGSNCGEAKNFYAKMKDLYRGYEINKKALDGDIKKMKELQSQFPDGVIPADLNITIPDTNKILNDAVKLDEKERTYAYFEYTKEKDYETPIKKMKDALKKLKKESKSKTTSEEEAE
ncbi:MAG: hypothetical protein JW812_00185, partial [Alphaproteobacteria bacterium]|nr:hypothetical protein [Alphaproteobacteria bacterium]MBN2779649.1 hypothetical protein [Alphaproteobacteria bacterium]